MYLAMQQPSLHIMVYSFSVCNIQKSIFDVWILYVLWIIIYVYMFVFYTWLTKSQHTYVYTGIDVVSDFNVDFKRFPCYDALGQLEFNFDRSKHGQKDRARKPQARSGCRGDEQRKQHPLPRQLRSRYYQAGCFDIWPVQNLESSFNLSFTHYKNSYCGIFSFLSSCNCQYIWTTN